VIFPDSYGSRGLPPQCKVREREVKPARDRVADANAAFSYLSQRPDVDQKAISLVGWSNGGSSTLYAVEPKNKPAGAADFARAIAFYPGCRTPLETGRWSARVPLTILIGASDDWTPAAPCVDLGAAAKAAGESVEVVTYPGAYHDFDHPDLPLHTLSGLAFTGEGGDVAHTGTNPAARADAIVRVMALLKQQE
jgi:dienelactone hydrolase